VCALTEFLSVHIAHISFPERNSVSTHSAHISFPERNSVSTHSAHISFLERDSVSAVTAHISFPERNSVSAHTAHISFLPRILLSVCSHSTLLTLSTMVLSYLIPSHIPASFLARSPIPSVVAIPWSSPYLSHDLEKPAHNLPSLQ